MNLVLPPAPSGVADGDFPIIGVYHGWGGAKLSTTGNVVGRSRQAWAQLGVATFSMTDRGFGAPCGRTAALASGDPDCLSKNAVHPSTPASRCAMPST